MRFGAAWEDLGGPGPSRVPAAAAVGLATSGELTPGQALDRLLTLLDALQGRNPAWRRGVDASGGGSAR